MAVNATYTLTSLTTLTTAPLVPASASRLLYASSLGQPKYESAFQMPRTLVVDYESHFPLPTYSAADDDCPPHVVRAPRGRRARMHRCVDPSALWHVVQPRRVG